MISGDRWEKDHKDPRSLDRFLKMRMILIYVFIRSSQMIFGWSRSKIFEANKLCGYQFSAIMINNIYKFLKIILFEPLICYRWLSAMTREPIWLKKIQKRKNIRIDSTWRIGRSLIELKVFPEVAVLLPE